MFLGKVVLKICSKFTGEHPCRSVISIKLLCNFIEIALRHGCSPVNLLHIFSTCFNRNTSGRLLLSLFTLTNFICINLIYVRDVSNLSAYSNFFIIAHNHKSEVTPSKLLEFIESRHLLLPLCAKDLILDSGVLHGPPNVLLLLP